MIWNNSLVRIANKTFFYKHWAKAGVLKIKDLMNDDFKIVTFRDFCLQRNVASPFSSSNFMEWPRQ